jgi:hypothetical protein
MYIVQLLVARRVEIFAIAMLSETTLPSAWVCLGTPYSDRGGLS